MGCSVLVVCEGLCVLKGDLSGQLRPALAVLDQSPAAEETHALLSSYAWNGCAP